MKGRGFFIYLFFQRKKGEAAVQYLMYLLGHIHVLGSDMVLLTYRLTKREGRLFTDNNDNDDS